MDALGIVVGISAINIYYGSDIYCQFLIVHTIRIGDRAEKLEINLLLFVFQQPKSEAQNNSICGF